MSTQLIQHKKVRTKKKQKTDTAYIASNWRQPD